MKKRRRQLTILLACMLSFALVFIGGKAYAAEVSVSNETELNNAIQAGDNPNLTADIILSKSILIPAGKEITIKGNGRTISSDGTAKLQLFKIEESKVTFENITLDGAQKTQGIWLEKANLELNNVKMINFISTGKPGDLPNGGAVYALDTNVNISDSTFENNKSTAGGSGGAIFFTGDSTKKMVVTGSTFIKNSNFIAESPQNTGGAIHFQSKLTSGGRPTLEVSESIFQIGTPFNTGGGIRLLDAVATVSKTEFKIENLPDRYGVSGGGVCSENSEFKLIDSKFTANGTSKIAFAGGFVDIVGKKGTSNISNCTFTGKGQGNSLEMASFGGAICYETGIGGEHVIDNCTFTNLSSSDTGGAISIGTRKDELKYPDDDGIVYENSSANVTISNSKINNTQTLLWSNKDHAGGAIYVGPGNTLKLIGTTITNGKSNVGGLIYNAGTTEITGGSKLSGGIGFKLGGAIYNNGVLTVDDAEVAGDFVGNGAWSGNPHPDKPEEYGGVNIYAAKDVTITPKAKIVAGKDTRVIDGQSKIILTGPLTNRLDVSISEEATEKPADPNEKPPFAEYAYRKVGYLVATGNGTYVPTEEDAKTIHYFTKKEDASAAGVHDDIGKWDYVLDPVAKTVVLGQRAKMIYHANASDAQFADTTKTKDQIYTIYSSKSPWTNPVQMTPLEEAPTRPKHSMKGWFIEPEVETLFDFEKTKFVNSTGDITAIANPSTINVYAGWEKNIEISVNKVWKNTEDSEKVDVTIKLLGDKVETEKTIKIAKDSDGEGKFEDVEVYKYIKKDGKYQSVEIDYSVEENTLPDFDTIYSGNKQYGFVVTNIKKAAEFNVVHEFVSGTAGKTLPNEVIDLIPDSYKAKKGEMVAPTDFTPKVVEVTDGTWTFTSWDQNSAEVQGDIAFIGTWTFEEDEPEPPTEYKVVHEFVSGTTGKELPQEIKALLPGDKTAVDGATVTPSDVISKVVEVEDGTWTFTNWDKNSEVVSGADVKFTGTWTFEANDPEPPTEYKVVHEFVSGTTGKELPQEIKALLPGDKTAVDGATVTPSDVISKVVEVEDGTWTFINWDKNSEVVSGADVKFIGTWNFTKNEPVPPTKYNVIHRFVSGTFGKELPSEVLRLLPLNYSAVSGETVYPTQIFSNVVNSIDGIWRFVGWDKNSDVIKDKDVVFTGTWTFTSHSITPDPKPDPRPFPWPGTGGTTQPSPKPLAGVKEPTLIIKDHYAYMFGYPNVTFRAGHSMTRAEATVMFARIMEQKPVIGKVYPSDYKDVTADAWYYNAIGFMKDMGIVSGYPDGSFRPNAPITRAEFAMMASKFAKINTFTSNAFTDLSSSHWAYEVINSAASKGWVSGYPDGTFKADKEISRAEVVTIVNRMLERKADKEFVLSHKSTMLQFKDLDQEYWAYFDIMEATHGHDFTRKGTGIDEIWHRLNGKEFPFAVVGYKNK